MTPTQRKAMEQALEALRLNQAARPFAYRKAITALRTALAEQPAEQEPNIPGLAADPSAFVRWASKAGYDMTSHPLHFLFLNEKTAAARDGWKAACTLYTAPQPVKRVPLTEEEVERVCAPLGAAMLSFTEVARAIEKAHGITGETE